MKKALLMSAALLSVSGLAHAQSKVTLYGLIDDGLTFSTNQGGSRTYQLQPGIAQADRWGLTGSEDLGGGLAAIFTLEAGFNGNTGTASQGGREFGRMAFVGLSSRKYGIVTMGRQDALTSDYITPFTANYWGILFAHPGDLDNSGSSFRMNNAVRYASPIFGGLQVLAQYSFGNQTQFSNQASEAAAINYANGPLAFAVAFLSVNNPALSVSEGNWNAGNLVNGNYGLAASRYQVLGAGASYKFGKVKLAADWTNTKFLGMDPTVGAKLRGTVNFNIYELTASYFATPTLMFGTGGSYTRGDVAATGKHPAYYNAEVFADYFLSKRTDVYVQSTYMQAAGDAQFADMAPILSASSNKRQAEVRVGLRVKF